MFIHWGIYALTEYSEQAFARLDYSREQYEALMAKFNPSKYNPEEWVILAKEAGMKYICFTTKHHDGFCMWDTKYTDYNIMHTPYGKDVLKMLADACRKHDMLLSLYYSNPDWNHEHGYNSASTHQWKAKQNENADFENYRNYIKNQVTELLTNYGPIYTFFWDISPQVYDPSMNELLRKLQPNMYINDRGFDKGDFSTPERIYGNDYKGAFTSMTEACDSVGVQSWGYRKKEDFASIRYLTTSIDYYMAHGASYLLNVGPNAEGVITEEYASKIREVGRWYQQMESCLECHEEDTFDYGFISDKCIITKKNEKTYFHFYEGLRSSAVVIENIPSLPKQIRLLNRNEILPFGLDALPVYFDDKGVAITYLHISDIPVDTLSNEAIVLEIDWNKTV